MQTSQVCDNKEPNPGGGGGGGRNRDKDSLSLVCEFDRVCRHPCSLLDISPVTSPLGFTVRLKFNFCHSSFCV